MKYFIVFIFLLIEFGSLSQDFGPEERFRIDSLEKVIRNENIPDTSKVRARLSLALYYYTTDLDTTFILCKEAEQLSEKVDWEFGRTESYGWLGYLYNVTGDLDKAIAYNEKSMRLAKKSGDIISITTLLNNNANIYSEQGRIEEAMDCFYEALRIHEARQDTIEISRAWNNIARLNRNQGFEDKALEQYKKALEMRRQIGDKGAVGETLNNIGVIYASKGETEKAEKYYREALSLRKVDGSPSEVANSLNNLGNLKGSMGQFDSALVYQFQSLDLRNQYSLGPGICESSIDIGYIYFHKKDYESALKYSLKGYQMAKDYGSIRLIKNATATLYSIYEVKGQKDKAFDFYQEYITMRDSMSNKETQLKTAQKDANYEYEKRKAIDDAENEKRLAIKEEEKKRQSFIIIAAISGLLIVGLFLLFVFSRLRLTRKQKNIIELQKKEVDQRQVELELAHQILEDKNTEILDSITYAKRIQMAILPPSEVIEKLLPNSFVLYLPKDIVAGDFYWMQAKNDKVLFAAADCTGHGVPGAMVSVVCNNGLNRAVREYGLNDPGEILNKTREIVIEEFSKSSKEVKDGMDIALCSISKSENTDSILLEYAGAHNPLWIIRNGKTIEYKADKQPIGQFEHATPFTTHQIELMRNDIFYIFSDGFVDQFGGEKGKKLKSKGFKELLIDIHHLSLPEQKQHLATFFEKWMGKTEQLDDVCVIGVRV